MTDIRETRSNRRNMSVDETQAESLHGRLCVAAQHERVEELRALVKLGAERGILVIVDVADLEAVPPVDVLDPVAQDEILAKSKANYWDAAHGGPACATWSAALFNLGSGFPEPYRSRDCRWGLPVLAGRRQQ